MKRTLGLLFTLFSCAAFACWTGGGSGGGATVETPNQCHGYSQTEYRAYGKMTGRFAYIAGVNNFTPHVDSITYSERTESGTGSSGGNSSTAYMYYGDITCSVRNNQTVSLPITVYVGVLSFKSPGSADGMFGFPRTGTTGQIFPGLEGGWSDGYTPDMNTSQMTICLQYRVDPSPTWITVKTIYYMDLSNPVFNLWDLTDGGTGKAELKWSRKRLVFGKGVIDGNYPAGTKILIRLSVSNSEYGTASLSSPVVNSFSEIPDTETITVPAYSCTLGSVVCAVCGEVMASSYYFYGLHETFMFGGDAEKYDGWSPLHFMSVTVSGERRPNQ